MDEFGNELEEIKREIVESRSLTIKTNNLVNALAADVKSIAKRFQGYERRLTWNSATAYAVFVAIVLFAGKVILDARVDAIRAQTKDTYDLADKLQAEVATLQSREQRRARAQNVRAADYYEPHRRRKAPRDHRPVRRGVASGAEPHRAALVRRGARAPPRTSYRSSRTRPGSTTCAPRAGTKPNKRSAIRSATKPDAAHSSEARYQLAVTLRALGRQRDAIPMLIELSEASADKEVVDDATFLLAQCQLDIEAWNDAKTTLRTFIRRFPGSAHLNDVRAKLAEVQLYH